MLIDWSQTAPILGLRPDAWITAGVVGALVGGLIWGRIGADLIMLSGLAGLLLTGVLTVREAVQGFANPAVLTVGFLYVVAAGLKETGGMTMLTEKALGRPRTLTGAKLRLVGPVALTSAFVNNTPIVAMFLPILNGWARKHGLPSSRLFMPLSFAAILGGMCTLIGTSTNLIVQSLLADTIAAEEARGEGVVALQGLAPLGMFTLAIVGLPVAVVGMVYMLTAGRVLLREHEERVPLHESPREYTVSMRVEPGSPIVGKTVEEAGLRQLPGLFLSRIDRDGEEIAAVGPDQTIIEDDILIFVGVLDSVVDLQKIKGLTPMTGRAGEEHARPRHQARLIEVVVSNASPILSRSIRQAGFRARYDAVVIAVHRNGGRIEGKIGDIVLRAGDTLLLEAGPDFAKRFRDSRDFYLVNELPGVAAPRHRLAPVAIGVMAVMVLAISLMPAMAMAFALAGSLAMVATRCCTGPEARASVDWRVLLVIGAAFGLGAAIEKTGLASALARVLVDWAGGLGPMAVVGVIYLLTAVFTSLITNNAAAVLIFPIAIEAARDNGLPALPIAIVVAIAASAGFATPLGYQTNLMVMGPGGYTTKDFLRFGGPLTLLSGLIAVLAISLFFEGV